MASQSSQILIDLEDEGEVTGHGSDQHHDGNNGGGGGAFSDRPTIEVSGDKEVNWFSSPFYLGNFFTRQADSTSAMCNLCPMTSKPIKTKSGNTTGLAPF